MLFANRFTKSKSTLLRRFKVRLVDKGYTYKERVDFKEVFSSIVRHVSIRVL